MGDRDGVAVCPLAGGHADSRFVLAVSDVGPGLARRLWLIWLLCNHSRLLAGRLCMPSNSSLKECLMNYAIDNGEVSHLPWTSQQVAVVRVHVHIRLCMLLRLSGEQGCMDRVGCSHHCHEKQV